MTTSLMAEEKPYDYLIKDVLIFDGESNRPLRGDVAISGEAISEVGNLSETEAREVVSGEGFVLAPGFIDAHTHSDFNPFIYAGLPNKLMQGVTTEIVGNCGMSAAPVLGEHAGHIATVWSREGVAIPQPLAWTTFREYQNELEYSKMGTNFAILVGHGNLRASVMGMAARPADAGEVAAMKKLLKDAMENGAFGISFGLVYLPGVFATEDELVELCREAGRHNGICAFHLRSEGSGLLEALREAIRIGEKAGARIQISHLKAAGRNNWDKITEAFRVIEEARAKGIRIAADAYPYTASFAELGVILPDSLYERPDRVALFQNVAERDRLKKELDIHFQKKNMDWESIRIATTVSPAYQSFEGKTIQAISRETGKDPITLLIELLADNSFQVSAFNFSQSEKVVEEVIQKPYVAIGSDSIADGSRHPHPRAFGTFPKIFKDYVQAEPRLELGEAIRKMTSLPAKHFGIENRGLVRAGYYADLVLFDPKRMTDRANYESPQLFADGVMWVFVNGEPVVRNGRSAEKKKGQVLIHVPDRISLASL